MHERLDVHELTRNSVVLRKQLLKLTTADAAGRCITQAVMSGSYFLACRERSMSTRCSPASLAAPSSLSSVWCAATYSAALSCSRVRPLLYAQVRAASALAGFSQAPLSSAGWCTTPHSRSMTLSMAVRNMLVGNVRELLHQQCNLLFCMRCTGSGLYLLWLAAQLWPAHRLHLPSTEL